MQQNLDIRIAGPEELDAVLAVERAAFGSDVEPALVRALLADESATPRLSLLALLDNRPVGHILFTHAPLENNAQPVTASLLAPLAVIPQAQNQGIGGALIRQGLQQLRELGTELVFVLGYPDYYQRHGFIPAGALGLQAPHPISPAQADAWMVQALVPDLLGKTRGTVGCASSLDKPEYWTE